MMDVKKWQKCQEVQNIIYNPSSAAPGFVTKNIFHLTKSVSSILNSMIENCKRYSKGSKVYSKTINLQTVESLQKIETRTKIVSILYTLKAIHCFV